MANVAQLIRRQSSRELLRVPLDKLELRELQHRLLPGQEPIVANPPLYGAANAAFVDDANNSTQQVHIDTRMSILLHLRCRQGEDANMSQKQKRYHMNQSTIIVYIYIFPNQLRLRVFLKAIYTTVIFFLLLFTSLMYCFLWAVRKKKRGSIFLSFRNAVS